MLALGGSVLPAEAALTQQRELGLNLRPQLLVDQRVPPAVQSGPGGDPLPAHWAAQRSFVHRLKEAGLKNKKWHHIMDKSLQVERAQMHVCGHMILMTGNIQMEKKKLWQRWSETEESMCCPSLDGIKRGRYKQKIRTYCMLDVMF